jgi:quinol-cytochrome oxidoreductase complex cytochrome b subunit
MSISSLVQYFSILTVSFHDINSLYGFFLILVVVSQLVSGTMVSFSLIPEPMIVPIVRDEEDLEDLYTDDFFWIHERGVDLLFIFSWIHLFRKLYVNAFEYEHEVAWKSGVFTFLILQAVTFFGLVLCCTHLSEITLTIAANVINTFVLFTGKVYWWVFTDKNLNSDTLIRVAYAHYVSAFYMAYLSVLHGIDMHYDWKNETSYDGVEPEMIWWDEALANELGSFLDVIVLLNIACWVLYPEPEALSYELFMWGDVGIVTDVRFYGVAPHWYFRPYMAWLIVCPYHNLGIFGLLYFFWVLFHQPTLHGMNDINNQYQRRLLLFRFVYKKKDFFVKNYFNPELSLYFQFTYATFIMCALYTSSFLPYGRFYNRLGGNIGMLGAYLYLLVYLTFTFLRRPVWLELYYYHVFNQVTFLTKIKRDKIEYKKKFLPRI